MKMEDEENFHVKNSVAITVLLFIFMVVIVITNGLVAGLLVTKQRLRKVPNVYVVFLSASQLLIGTFVIISTVMSLHVIKTTRAWCIIASFVQLFSFTAAMFSLIGITVDRYRSVMQPLTYKPTIKRTIIIIIALVLAAAIYSLHVFIYSGTTGDNSDDEGDNHTISEDQTTKYCDFLNEDESSDLWFRIVDFFMLLIIPTISMTVMYFQIKQKLWAKNMDSNESIRKKRNAVRLSIVCVVTFILCWLPFYMVDIIHDSIEMTTGKESGNDSYLVLRFITIFLALLNSVVNPVIYGFLNKNFQRELLVMKNTYCCKASRVGNIDAAVKTLSSNVAHEPSNTRNDKYTEQQPQTSDSNRIKK